MHSDLIIIVGMIFTAIGVVTACGMSRLVVTRFGFVGSGATVCVGLAHFGHVPFFGGSHSLGTYFGCISLCVGVLGLCLFGAIEEIWRRLDVTPNASRGFEVSPAPARDEHPIK